MDPMNMTLDNQSFWSSGSFEHFMRQAVPLLVFAALMFLVANAAKRGLRIFQRPDATTTADGTAVAEEVADTEAGPAEQDQSEEGRKARAYDGFDPSMYGAPPESREDDSGPA